MKKYLTIVAALLTLNILGAKAQTSAQRTDLKCGETVTITATPDSGYIFLYWDDDHTLTDSIREVTITSELDLYDYVAVFSQIQTYTLTVTSNEPTMGTVTGGGNYQAGAEIEIKAEPVSKCYRFKEWSDGNTDATRTVKVTDKAATNTYVAYFEEVEFTVKVSTAVGGKVTIARK